MSCNTLHLNVSFSLTLTNISQISSLKKNACWIYLTQLCQVVSIEQDLHQFNKLFASVLSVVVFHYIKTKQKKNP